MVTICTVSLTLSNSMFCQYSIFSAHAHCMLVNLGYIHTLRTLTHCFSTAKMAARTLLIVTLHVHCLYCYNLD